jgi:hypothetical protein
MGAAPSLLVAALAVCGLQACTLVRHGAPSERQFWEGLSAHPYVADPVRAATVLGGVRRLHVCSRISDVRQAMGLADFGTRTSDSNGNVNRAVKWTYVLRESATDPGRFEQAIEVEINDAGWVFTIMPRGVYDVAADVVVDGPGCEHA